MTDMDDIILEFLEDSGAILNKRGLEINLEQDGYEVSYSSLKRHLPQLEEAGLVEKVVEDGSWYEITSKGEQYLEGEVDLRED